MDSNRRNRRGNFGRSLQQERTSNRFVGVLKSSAPKDTEVNASCGREDFDPKPSRSVEFGQKFQEEEL